MRIGEFSKKYGLTIDTIRHYMDLELLLPDKQGGHYFFGQKEIDDLKKILELKELKFTLAEIQRIVAYSRLSQLRTKEDKSYIRKILSAQFDKLEIEEHEIKIALNMLKDKINEIENIDEMKKIDETDEVKMGIPISFIQNFSCPICNNPLELEDGKITRNMVTEGHFKCKCDYRGNVENGIYISLDEDDIKKVPKQNPGNETKGTNTMTIGQYVEETNLSFVNYIYKSIDAIIDIMNVEDIDNKIILELGTGSGIFLRQFISYIKPENIYIVTDHDINKIMDIKLYLQKHLPTGKFVFICTDLSKIPIKNEITDYAINYATSLTYNLNDDRMLDSVVLSKIKKGGKLIGCYAYVKSGSKLLLSVPEASRKYYEEKGFKKAIDELPLKVAKVKEMGYLEEVESKFEDLIRGTKLYALVYCGEK